MKIKLPNGNVANRVLPVQIHDLDIDDIKECESVLGGALRGIEFIYKEPGADKPLAPEDNEKKNLNNTKYRIQIIKVAHAIKEIIQGLTGMPGKTASGRTQYSDLPGDYKIKNRIEYKKGTKITRSAVLSGILMLLILVVCALFAYPKIFDHDNLANLRSPDGKISIAVMPFQNMTNDTIWNVWQDGIQDNLITSLAFSDGLKVRQIKSINGLLKSKEFSNYASMTPAIASSISQKLDASMLIYGSINQAGITIRVNAQLIDRKTTESIKSFQVDGAPENILKIVDSLSRLVTNFLLISKLKTESSPSYKYYTSTSSPEAYRYFMYGQKAFINGSGSYAAALNWYLQAISIDSNLIAATLQIAQLYEWERDYDQAQKWCLKAYQKRDKMTLQDRLLTNIMYANLFETPNEMLNYWKQLIEIEDQIPLNWLLMGRNYIDVEQYEMAIPVLEKGLNMLEGWGKIESIFSYQLMLAYHKTGLHEKEKQLFNIAKQDTLAKLYFDIYQIVISLDDGDTIAAKRYYKKYLPYLKEYGSHEIDGNIIKYSADEAFLTYLAVIYSDAGNLDKAEKIYRRLLLLHPEEPWILSGLASILIDQDRNIEEGMVLN